MTNSESPCLLVAIVDRNKHMQLEEVLNDKHVFFQFLGNAMGTARSEVLNVLGLSGTEKSIAVCIMHHYKAHRALRSVMERMEMVHPGHGIAFTIPLTGACKNIVGAIEAENQRYIDRKVGLMEQTETQCEAKYGLIIAVVNNGFSEDVMNVAREGGVRGGTILHVRQAALEEASKFFGIAIQPDKEMVMMIADDEHKAELMRSINKACGMLTDAHGLLLSLPVESCVGLVPIE